ncbi:MAG: starch-binding protein [Bacteroidaceae bacterium]|nr:starch-binding protein [Bacteroidaceae bacterium]
MKRLLILLLCATHLSILSSRFSIGEVKAQGWPADYGGVMLQGFYWDSFGDSQWKRLEAQVEDFAPYFSLVWIPQSGNCGGTSMGYDDLYWFNNYNSSFGNEAELRSLITTFRNAGIGTIADVVINHRKNVSNWVDFPTETYKGVTYTMTSTDICANDDGGATMTWAKANGYELSSAYDTGEGWGGMRDLDHTSQNVQNTVMAYLDFLKNDLGYAGFRYDMVKGYAGSYTKMYNEASQPDFSVGECWDGTTTIRKWIDATEKTSAAFDFQFRYTVRNAVNTGNWSKLGETNDGNWPLISSNYLQGNYRQWAVTFVENHDTEYRSAASQQDPIRRDTLAANAHLLASPGTPCVFLKHWKAYKYDIARMIQARKLCGILNTSTTADFSSSSAYYSYIVNGSNGRLLVWLGDQTDASSTITDYIKILEGKNYSYWIQPKLFGQWNSLSKPEFAEDKVERKDITIYLKDPGWDKVYFYAWDGNLYINDSWPGVQVTDKRNIDGTDYYYRTFNVSAESDYTMNVIFDKGSNQGQTVDITGINSDRYYEIASTTNKYTVNDISDALPVHSITEDNASSNNFFDLSGRRIYTNHGAPIQKGLYITKGHKIVFGK